jgi:hypothetical protein
MVALLTGSPAPPGQRCGAFASARRRVLLGHLRTIWSEMDGQILRYISKAKCKPNSWCTVFMLQYWYIYSDLSIIFNHTPMVCSALLEQRHRIHVRKAPSTPNPPSAVL